MRLTRILPALLAFFTAFAGEETRIYEEYQVSLHQLHVNVTDKSGNPIRDLTAEDFTVKLNGKNQEVVSVIPISLEQAVKAGDAVPEQGRRMFVFLFDMQNNAPAGILKARSETMKFVVSDMLPNDLGAMFTMAGNNIRMVCNFTSDKAQLLKALETFGFDEDAGYWSKSSGFVAKKNAKDKTGVSARQAFHSLSKQVIEADEYIGTWISAGGYDNPLAYIHKSLQDPRDESKKGEMSAYLDLFKEFADYLKVIDGTKNLVVYSAGFADGQLAVGTSRSFDESGEAFASGEIISTARRLVEVLEGSGVKVYTVDTSRSKGSAWQNNTLHVLNDLSSSTGGRLFTNSEDYGAALRQIKTITNDYYLVQIQTNVKVDKGELARVKVKVDRPKARVYTSKGLLVKPDFQSLSEMERKLMLTNFVSRDMVVQSIPASLDVTRIHHESGATRVNLDIELEGSYFIFSDDPNKPVSLEVMAAIIDPTENLMIDQTHHTINFVPEAARPVLEKTGVKFFADLFTEPGAFKLKMVVRNLGNGQTTSVIRDLNIPENPLMLADPVAVTMNPWVVINSEDLPVAEGVKPLEKNGYPFLFGETRFLPAARAGIKAGQPLQVLYLLEPALLTDPNDFSLEINVFDNQQQKLNADASALKMTALKGGIGNRIGLLVSLDPAAFQFREGQSYRVQALVETSKTGKVASDYDFTM